jgi:hypothetical protein
MAPSRPDENAAPVLQPVRRSRLARHVDSLLPDMADPQDRSFYRDLLIFGGALFALTLIVHFATMTWMLPAPRDNTTLPLGRDFLNFWMYGRAAVSDAPGRYYDLFAYQDALAKFLGPGFPGQNWSYPPSVMLIAAPFGLVNYLTALAIWTVLGVVLFVSVARRHVLDARMLVLVMISPAVTFCLISGQSSLVTSAMLLTIFAWLDRRPLAAGALIGLLTIKPQLGFLFPLLLIASGRWRVFAAATVTTLALVAITTLLFGVEIWQDFLSKGMPVQNRILADPDLVATPFYTTVFMNVRGLDLSPSIAMAVQLMFSAFAAAVLVWAFWAKRDADPDLLRALFFAATVSASPYLLAYDSLPLMFATLALLVSGKLDGPGRRLAQLVFWLPSLQLVFGAAHIPGPALIAPAFVAYLGWRLGLRPVKALAPA